MSANNVDEKVRELIKSMSLEEKMAQLSSAWADELLENGQFSEEKARNLLKNGIGEITRISGRGFKPKDAASVVNKIQRFLINETRLKIPTIIHEECLAGLQGPSSTCFPQSIGLASTWSVPLMKKVAISIGKQVRTVGGRQGLAPVLDLAVDPRWGRTEETYGEDPYLVSSMGVAYVSSLQAQGVAATGKHFAGHGSSEGGRNTAPVNVSERFLRENHLRTFEAAV
ncbi:MAG: glycoside hydrolase family 3 N-terminal domain-containing protein, partial [TACK group archaeon]|nr:glycoside hydrolase family 3 N-terminal domain-containing protein [TACK group archaeon]